MEWPARFIYVCSASNAAIVNVLPLSHAGLDRVERVIVFCGAKSAEETDARVRREAIEPADRLKAYIEFAVANVAAAPPVQRRYGDPNQLGPWVAHMHEIASEADADTPIVFNLTGGTKAMAIGGILGLGTGTPTRVPVYVSGTPPRTQFINGLSQHEAPRHSELTLPQYLSAYGMRELDPRSRADKEAYYETYRDRLLAFGGAMIPQAMNLIPALRRRLDRLRPGASAFQPGVIDAAQTPPGARSERSQIRTTLAAALSQLTGLPGFSSNMGGPGWRIENESVADLLDSGWLEAYLYLRLAAIFPGRGDVSVHANVRLGYANDPDAEKRRERGEIDVALLIRGQLHLVEAKTSSFSSNDAVERNDKALSQTESLKRQLVGNLGCCFVVNPRDTLDWLREAQGNFVSRAESAGIELLLGRGGATILERRVRELVPPT